MSSGQNENESVIGKINFTLGPIDYFFCPVLMVYFYGKLTDKRPFSATFKAVAIAVDMPKNTPGQMSNMFLGS